MRSVKPKVGVCIDCTDGKEKPLTAKRCDFHYKLHRYEANKWKREKRNEMKSFLKKPIPKVSEKQLKRLEEYRKVRNEFMKSHPTCEARLKGCTIKATDLHHSKGRIGDLLTDKKYFKALCRKCHNFIEAHPNYARENGFSANRLTTNI